MDATDTILERLAPVLGPLEARRRRALEQRNLAWAITLVTGFVSGFFALANSGGNWMFPFPLLLWIIPTVIAGAIGHAAFYGPAQRAFVTGFKREVVGGLARALAPDLDFTPEAGIPEPVFRATQLFPTRPDRYRTEDRLSGRIGETNVTIAEVVAEERRSRTDSNGKTETYYVTIFSGVLMVADFHKDFHGVTRVLPDNESGLLAGIGKAMQGFFPFGGKDLVRLEDPEFENHFAVYSSDQIEARYLLSSSLMRRILTLRAAWGNPSLRLSFLDSRIHVAIPTRGNLFEPHLDRSVTDDDQLQRLTTELRSCLELVEHLNLDTRIWTRRPSPAPGKDSGASELT